MIYCPKTEVPAILVALESRRALTDQQLASLKAELESPAYADLSDEQAVVYLHGNHSTREVRSDATWPATEDWLRDYQRGLLVGRDDLSSAVRSKWIMKIPSIMAAYGKSYTYNADTAATFAAIAADAIADGVATEAEVAAFRARWKSTEPVAPVVLLFGEGVIVEVSDVAQARAI